jgi:hypothetical protein
MTKKLVIVTLASLMITSLAVAKEIGGAKLPDSFMAGDVKLLLNGAAFTS